jgi:hypothetical protein
VALFRYYLSLERIVKEENLPLPAFFARLAPVPQSKNHGSAVESSRPAQPDRRFVMAIRTERTARKGLNIGRCISPGLRKKLADSLKFLPG